MLKTIWGFILRLFGLEKKGVDEVQMQHNTHFAEQYEDISKINFTSIFANKLTTLAVSESTADIDGDNARADFQKECLKALWENRKRLTSRMLGTGGCVAAPYVKDGELLYDLIPQSRVIITEKQGERITGAVILADSLKRNQKVYYRLTDYRVQGETLAITNRVIDGSGSPATVSEWKDIADHSISGVDRVLFAFFKSPIDNRKSADEYGVPVTFGCDGLMQEIQETLKEIEKEFKQKKARVFADERFFRYDQKTGKRILPGEAFIAANMEGSNSAMEIFSPDIRDSSYYNRLLHLFELLEKAVGTSKGILTAPETRGATATEIKASIYDTYALVADIRTVLEKGIGEYLQCCDVLANYYGLAPMGEYDLKFDWSYSMIESSSETWAQLKDAQAMGVKSKAEVRIWLNPNETLEEAEEKIQEIQKNEPTVTNLLGE
ncbi:MAG: phage portal protein [Anaerotignum sp.]|nr:phage portal protein [Anaerotignum sp.]